MECKSKAEKKQIDTHSSIVMAASENTAPDLSAGTRGNKELSSKITATELQSRTFPLLLRILRHLLLAYILMTQLLLSFFVDCVRTILESLQKSIQVIPHLIVAPTLVPSRRTHSSRETLWRALQQTLRKIHPDFPEVLSTFYTVWHLGVFLKNNPDILTELQSPNAMATESKESRTVSALSDSSGSKVTTLPTPSPDSYEFLIQKYQREYLDTSQLQRSIEHASSPRSFTEDQDNTLSIINVARSDSTPTRTTVDDELNVRPVLHGQASKVQQVQMNEKRQAVQRQRCSTYEKTSRSTSASPTAVKESGRLKSCIPIAERRPAMKRTLEGGSLKPLKLQRRSR